VKKGNLRVLICCLMFSLVFCHLFSLPVFHLSLSFAVYVCVLLRRQACDSIEHKHALSYHHVFELGPFILCLVCLICVLPLSFASVPCLALSLSVYVGMY
jgi:hypothetical protein